MYVYIIYIYIYIYIIAYVSITALFELVFAQKMGQLWHDARITEMPCPSCGMLDVDPHW